MLRLAGLLVGSVFTLIVMFLGINFGLYFMTEPNDIEVLIGVLLVTLCLLGGAFMVRLLWKHGKSVDWKRLVPMIIAVIAITSLTGCCSRIGPGYVGIVIKSAGSNKGVLDQPVKTGYVWYNPVSETVIEYPTFMQTAKWTQNPNEGKPVDESVTFTNKESMTINADVSLSYALDGSKVPAFYVQFHSDDLDQFTHGFLRNVARDCFNEHAGKYSIEQIMGDNAQFITDTRKCVQDQVTQYGVAISQFGLIGAPRPPQVVIAQINQKVQAQQVALQTQIELATTQAEAAKKVAAAEGQAKAQIAAANGEAEANRIRNASITDKILEMRRLDNQHDAIWRWDGTSMPSVITGGQGLLFNIPSGK